MHGIYDKTTTKSLFTLSTKDHLRGHMYKLEKIRTKKAAYSAFFTNRIVNTWNKLPEHVVTSCSINSFKNKVDKLFKDKMYSINVDFYD